MEYLKWIGFVIQAISIALIFMAFVPLRQRAESEKPRMSFRPWLLAYGLVLFALGSLLDVIFKMNFLG